MKRLYKIWYVQHNKTKSAGISWVEFNPALCTWAYPLHEIISTLPSKYCRDDMVSIDLAKIINFCEYLNEMADEDVHYEIREEEYPDYLPRE